MTQEFFDIENISTGFQSMSSKTMSKCVDRARGRDVCPAQIFAEKKFNSRFSEMAFFCVSREQIAFRRSRSVTFPIVTQCVESTLRQNRIAVFSAFGLPDP